MASLISVSALAVGFSGAADCSCSLSCPLLGRLFIVPAKLHLAIHTFALQLFLQRSKRLIDVIIADDYLHFQTLVAIARSNFFAPSSLTDPGAIGLLPRG